MSRRQVRQPGAQRFLEARTSQHSGSWRLRNWRLSMIRKTLCFSSFGTHSPSTPHTPRGPDLVVASNLFGASANNWPTPRQRAPGIGATGQLGSWYSGGLHRCGERTKATLVHRTCRGNGHQGQIPAAAGLWPRLTTTASTSHDQRHVTSRRGCAPKLRHRLTSPELRNSPSLRRKEEGGPGQPELVQRANC